MSKFKFEHRDEERNKLLTAEFECGTWYEALDEFVAFLRGAGYNVTNKSVGINESAGHMFLNEDLFLMNLTGFEQE